jgi:SAM-dependent methyltransferase
VPHDVYERSPARAQPGISRRSLLRLGWTPRARADIDYDGVTARVRAGWDAGGHEPLLRALEPVAEVACELAAVGPGERVLDVGAGDGNVAAAALARGAAVDACDLAPAMVELGRARVPAARWRVADAQALPYPDATFDAVISTFGAALAPRARLTARELVRVARPGGIVVLAAWVPKGLPGRLDELIELPDGVRPPADWGVRDVVTRRLEPLLEGLELRTRTVQLSFPGADAFFAALARPLGLGDDARPAFDRLLASCNNLPDSVEVDARYLLTTGRRPA